MLGPSSTHPGPHWSHALAPVAPELLLSMALKLMVGARRTHAELKRNQLWHDPQGLFCSSTLESQLTTKKDVSHWAYQKPRLITDFGSTYSISSLISHWGDSCQITLVEDMTHTHFRPYFFTKATGHTYLLHTEAPTQWYTSKTRGKFNSFS